MFKPAFIFTMLMPLAVFAQPADVNRILRTFDFEERRLGNVEDLPMRWNKVEGTGLPHYVNGKLTTVRVRSGKYSFRFELNGGSIMYRYDAGQMKVQTGAHYRVEGFAFTTPMPNARARISAWFCDVDGQPLPKTITHSALYAAGRDDTDWKKLSLELSADDPAAKSLVIELSLLQPQIYRPATLGNRTLFPQDIRGTAWFDDIMVTQTPRVHLSTDRPGNIFRKGEPVRLNVLVSDRYTDDLAAQLVVHDAGGKQVYQRSGSLDIAAAESLGPGRKRLSELLPDMKPGWYSVSLRITSRAQHVGEQKLDLIQLADNQPFTLPDGRFGMIATDLPFEGWPALPEVLPFLGAGRVKLAIWDSTGDIQQYDADAFDQMLVRLQELRITPTACLIDLPPAIAAKLGPRKRLMQSTGAFATTSASGNESLWPMILKADAADWQPQLANLISRHANHLDRWQLGADGSEAFVNDPAMRQVYDRIHQEFSTLMFKPDLSMPWPAWYELEGRLPATVALSVPTSVLPSQLPLYMQDLKQHEGHNLSITLQLLDRQKYGRELQIRDLAQRMTYAMAADAKRLDIPMPFAAQVDGKHVTHQPRELFMIVRTLINTLGGSTFKGKVPIAEGVEAFLFDKQGEGILVMWDRGNSLGAKQLAINLGEKAQQLDLWGNVTPLVQANTNGGKPDHLKLDVGPMPIMLVDIDGNIAQLRASVAIDRPLIESTFQSHTRKLRFSNPYRLAISGSVKLKAPTGWTITPPTQTFNLNPGETFEREITIEFPYNSFAGAKIIQAEFALQADKNSSFNVPLTLNLGLSDVGMQTMALRDGADVIVQQVIQNYGDKPIDYSTFAIFPGQARQEKLITNLGPGRTTIKKYRFNNVVVPPNTRLRVGIKELNGTRVLNDEVEVN